jgi:ADP-L-glycero-D-manno-heptose 6-epimerase
VVADADPLKVEPAMFVVTGGAGFIGSNLVAALAERGAEVAVCDRLGQDLRWRNLARHALADLITPERLLAWLAGHRADIEAIVHLGAISTTTETDVERIVEHNLRATLDLLEWCTHAAVPFLYASSAATYGDGSAGFEDRFEADALAALRPLNAYGWSKHVVDRRIERLARERRPLPPQWVGLKFFNVYGPNEYHKGSMQSVIAQNYARVAAGGTLRLFRSGRPDYPDGGQRRDFIYVRDCVSVMAWLLEHREISGLFNLGTGRSRTWLDLAHALFDAAGEPRRIEFIDMPPALEHAYQYFTEASMAKLHAAGYPEPFTPLEEGVGDYVRNYLARPDPYR